MAQDRRKALDEKTKKLSQGGKIEEGKEHAAYQESQQQLLAIQAEQQQNLAVARAESKASFENNQTLAQAAELGAISAAEAEQAAQAGGQVTLNPATQSVLAKYGVGQPKFTRTQSHNQQVTKQNITINNNITSNTTNDVKVPANIGGPLQGRPLQFKAPSGEGSVGKFKTWISAAFARQNEEGAKRDREYRNRENSLTKSASRMMKKLEDIGKTIGTRMDPRKIGSTWQSQLKTLLLLFGFGYLTSNWTKVLETVSDIEQWVKNTWNYFSEGNFISDISGLLGGKPGQSIFESLKALFLGNDEEKGLFGLIKQFFKDMWEERAEAVKLVKAPDIKDALNDPIKAVKSLFEYLSNILTAAFSGAEGIKKIRLEESRNEVDKKSEERRQKYSTTDDYYTRTINGNKENVEQGTEAFIKGYKGISHHTFGENGELTSKFGAESSVSQMSELSRLVDEIETTGKYNTDEISHAVNRLSKFAGKTGMIPVMKSHINSILTNEQIDNLTGSGDLVRNVPYRKVYRPKTDDDYYRNFYGNRYTDPKLTVGASAALNTVGSTTYDGFLGRARAAGIVMRDPHGSREDNVPTLLYKAFTKEGQAIWSVEKAGQIDEIIKDSQNSKYRVEYVRADSPDRPGDIPSGDVEYFDEISKRGIKEISKGILTKGGSDLEGISVNPEDVTKYSELLRGAAYNPVKDRERIQKEKDKIDQEIRSLEQGVDPTYYVSAPTNGYDLSFKPGDQFVPGSPKTSSDVNRERIQELKKKREALSRKLYPESNIQSNLQDVEKLEAHNREREERRQQDFNNSPVGRVYNNFNNLTYNTSGGRWGTHTETLKANGSVDNDTLKYRKQYLFKTLREKGLSDGAIAGIIGNLEGEGLSLPAGKEVPDSRGTIAMGIAQFNSGGELPRLQAWSKQNGLDYKTFEAQAQYIANHKTIDKIARETKGLSPEDSLKKSAIIWGHDFEVFQGYDAADNHGNLIGKGKYIPVSANPNDKYRSDGKLHGDENYTERIQKGLNTYKTYAGSDLSEITIQSSNSFRQKDEDENKAEAKSFLEIFKEKVTNFITNLGGVYGKVNDKVNEAVSPVLEEAKRTIFKNGKMYSGPITKEFTDYDTYLQNQDFLPDSYNLPKGMSYADWKNRVYDMTGKMPQNLEVTGNPILPNIELKLKPVEGLREDSQKILSKYTTEAEEKSTGEWKDNTKTEFYSEVEKEKYREMIPDLEDPVLRSTLSADLIDKIQKVKKDDEKKAVAKIEDKGVKVDVSEDLVAVEENKPSFSLFDMLDTTKPKKAEDYIREIYENSIVMSTALNKLVAVESTNGITQARMVDATNNGTVSNVANGRNILLAISRQSANQNRDTASLFQSNNNQLEGI